MPSLRRGASDISVGDEILFPHDIEDGKATTSGAEGAGGRPGPSVIVDSALDDDDGRGRRTVSFGRGHRDYGAVANSEPLQAPVTLGAVVPVPGASAGNSRSRSKGRTPPRNVVRPMTRARRQAAIEAGASVGAVASVDEADGSVISVITDVDDDEARPQSPPSMRGRGRSADRRPISPIVAFRPLYQIEDEENEAAAARAAAYSNLYLPGTATTGERLSDDPAAVLDAEDLDLPTDECGHEVYSWQSALGVELPLLIRSTIPVFFTQLAEYSLSLASVVSIGHLGTADLAASSLANMTASVTCFSIMQGLATALDTLLPAAWTGSDRRHVGLWTMRCTVVMIAAMVSTLFRHDNLCVVTAHPSSPCLSSGSISRSSCSGLDRTRASPSLPALISHGSPSAFPDMPAMSC